MPPAMIKQLKLSIALLFETKKQAREKLWGKKPHYAKNGVAVYAGWLFIFIGKLLVIH
jgi:hypothetical protein